MIAGEEHELLVEIAKDPAVVRRLLELDEADEVIEVLWKDAVDASEEPVEDSTEDTAMSRIKIFRPDAVKLFGKKGQNIFAVALEAQVSWNLEKLGSWVYYPGRLFLEHRCDAETLVLTVSMERYEWVQEQHELLPKRFKALVRVIGPPQIPSELTDKEARENPALALLVAIKWSHIGEDKAPAEAPLRALAVAKEPLFESDPSVMALWYRAIKLCFDKEEIRQYMKTETNPVRKDAIRDYIQSEYAEELGAKDAEIARWQAESAQWQAESAQRDAEIAAGEARLVRAVIETVVQVKGWKLTEAQAQALATSDIDRLKAMRERAFHATSPEQIFEKS